MTAPMPSFSIRRLAILGVGLIGGSLALALRRAGVVAHIVGAGRSVDSVAQAVALGVIDEAAASPADAVRDADMVVLAAPVAQTPVLLAAIAPHVRDDAIVTDAGSTKSDAVDAARVAFGEHLARFVPGHPIAGGERSGAAAAQAHLYDGRRVVLCPLPENAEADVARVRAMWQAAGARVSCMSAEQHDMVFASVSHLPHLLAFALLAQILDSADSALKLDYAGAGFRDFTRIAASSPEMWRDICLANRAALLHELDGYSAALAALRTHLAKGDGAALERLFARASQGRRDWARAQEKS